MFDQLQNFRIFGAGTLWNVLLIFFSKIILRKLLGNKSVYCSILGGFLPPPQADLWAKYKEELWDVFGIEFNDLYTATNMPIKRFLDFLYRRSVFEDIIVNLVSVIVKLPAANWMYVMSFKVGRKT